MAATYGEPGKNPFALKGISGVLSPVVNSTTGVTQIYKQGALNRYQSLGTLDPKTGKFTADATANLSQSDIKALSSPEGTNNIKNAAKTATIQGVKTAGGSDAEAQAKANALIKPNSAATSPGEDGTGANPADTEEFDAEKGTVKEGTRTAYVDVRYPLNLSSQHQDCIKFSILEYRPSSASGSSTVQGEVSRLVQVKDGIPQIDKKPLGTITLPIPAGINDSNGVSWQDDTINELQQAGVDIAKAFMGGGVSEGTNAAGGATKTAEEALKDSSTQQGLIGRLAGIAVNSSKVQQRTSGTIFNNNLELLFNGPSLRSFSFTFKLSPREPAEARAVMQIIRFFKQAMAVKRSKSTLLLKTPHTFAISYLTSNKQHPYLNKFKECALTTFNVDYTPEGQYMTYMSSDINDRSMISYNISLSFQELEPVFDDEYGNEAPDQIKNIGY